jgi:hypothetical protein
LVSVASRVGARQTNQLQRTVNNDHYFHCHWQMR